MFIAHTLAHRWQWDEEEPLEERLGQYAREHVLIEPQAGEPPAIY